MHIDYNFKFHPVGFGLFTSGKIENFRFVYDCGTKSTQAFVENAIDSEFQAGDVIDLLVISHFHKDHISGIKKLLEDSHEDDFISSTENKNYINEKNKNSIIFSNMYFFLLV